MPPQNQNPYQPQNPYPPTSVPQYVPPQGVPMPPPAPPAAPAAMPEAVVTETRPQPFQDAAAGFFIAAMAVLSIVSILGVWRVFGSDVIGKSFSTIGLLAIISIVVIVAGRYVDKDAENAVSAGAPAFRSIRQVTLGVLIASAAGLALLGVLAIWEVVSDKDVVFRALSSLGILAFSALISVMVCLERENNHMARQSAGPLVILLFIVGWVFMSFMRW